MEQLYKTNLERIITIMDSIEHAAESEKDERFLRRLFVSLA